MIGFRIYKQVKSLLPMSWPPLRVRITHHLPNLDRSSQKERGIFIYLGIILNIIHWLRYPFFTVVIWTRELKRWSHQKHWHNLFRKCANGMKKRWSMRETLIALPLSVRNYCARWRSLWTPNLVSNSKSLPTGNCLRLRRTGEKQLCGGLILMARPGESSSGLGLLHILPRLPVLDLFSPVSSLIPAHVFDPSFPGPPLQLPFPDNVQSLLIFILA